MKSHVKFRTYNKDNKPLKKISHEYASLPVLTAAYLVRYTVCLIRFD